MVSPHPRLSGRHLVVLMRAGYATLGDTIKSLLRDLMTQSCENTEWPSSVCGHVHKIAHWDNVTHTRTFGLDQRGSRRLRFPLGPIATSSLRDHCQYWAE